MSQVLVEVTRQPLVENIHRGDVAVVDSEGRLLAWSGEPTRKVTFWRSSAKPFQAMPIVESGAYAHWGFTPADLAICCASHAAEQVHRDQVMSVLTKAGLTPDVLRCGAHPPYDRQEAEGLIRRGEKPGVLHSNCSGKHSGMCALAQHLGLPADGYLEAEHGVQKLILLNVSAMTDVPPERVQLGVDGCGVPVFGLPVYSMALAFARLMDPRDLPGPKQSAAALVRDAMLENPILIQGTHRYDSDLMTIAPGVLSKGGAAGVLCMAVSAKRASAAGLGERGIGVALKLEDGNGSEPRSSAGLEALVQLGLLSADEQAALQPYHRPAVKNFAGKAVGEVRPVYRLERG